MLARRVRRPPARKDPLLGLGVGSSKCWRALDSCLVRLGFQMSRFCAEFSGCSDGRVRGSLRKSRQIRACPTRARPRSHPQGVRRRLVLGGRPYEPRARGGAGRLTLHNYSADLAIASKRSPSHFCQHCAAAPPRPPRSFTYFSAQEPNRRLQCHATGVFTKLLPMTTPTHPQVGASAVRAIAAVTVPYPALPSPFHKPAAPRSLSAGPSLTMEC